MNSYIKQAIVLLINIFFSSNIYFKLKIEVSVRMLKLSKEIFFLNLSVLCVYSWRFISNRKRKYLNIKRN